MASVLELYNLAFSAAGGRRQMSSTTEVSREAELCNLWYPTVRDHIFRAAPWPSLRSSARLSVEVERDVDEAWLATDPEPGWRFAYTAPVGMVRPRYLSDFSKFVMATRPDGSVGIMSQTENAVMTFTKRVEQPQAWDTDLYFSVVYGLAAFITRPLNGMPELAATNREIANGIITTARVNAANTDVNMYETIPDWIAARGYSGNAPSTRFIYPSGSMLTVTEGVGVT